MKKLGRVQRAEGVSREITDQPERPMGILQATARVVRDRNLEQFLKAGVPRPGQIGHGQFSRDKPLLDLKAEDDVEIISRLVGLYPDMRRLYAVDDEARIPPASSESRPGNCFLTFGYQ